MRETHSHACLHSVLSGRNREGAEHWIVGMCFSVC